MSLVAKTTHQQPYEKEINKMEMLAIKFKILKEMDTYITENIMDEEQQELWLRLGIPDGADDDMILEIAEDEMLWVGICKLFGQIIGEA